MCQFRFEDEHIIVSADQLQEGRNAIGVEFFAGEQALNRNEDFLYALFVPDKASTAFPCFDQPNIKAKYTLSLSIPRLMTAFSNYSIVDVIPLEMWPRMRLMKRCRYLPIYSLSVLLF